MTDELEWTFPSVPKCEEKGLNDSGVEMFRGDTIVSLAREICQNSLDAAIRPADGTEPGPVEIEFSLFDLQASDFPAFDEFKDAMARSRDYWKENDQAVRFFDEMEPDLNAKVLHCLRISDANTTGLTGVHAPDSSSGSAWHSLVMSSGVSNKSRGITGGSFGIGKFAAFSCSRFRTVFYATKTADGKEGFQGVCRLVTFRDEQNNMTLGTSYVGARDMKPLARWWSPDTAYERTRPGTDIFIPAFVGGDGFRKDIVKSVLDGFLYAIWEKKLVVTIRDGAEPLIINKAWLIKAERTGDELFADARALFNALRQHESKWKVKSFGDLGEVRLSLVNGKDLDKRIAMIREPGMLIFKKDHFRSFVSFTGVLLVKGELNRILRDFENPQHNKWEEKRAPDNASYLKAIYTFCTQASATSCRTPATTANRAPRKPSTSRSRATSRYCRRNDASGERASPRKAALLQARIPARTRTTAPSPLRPRKTTARAARPRSPARKLAACRSARSAWTVTRACTNSRSYPRKTPQRASST